MNFLELASPLLAPQKKIPNVFPTTSTDYRIAIIGECPGRDDEESNAPFTGSSGRFLNMLLSKSGITRNACYIGNICQTRPPNNNIEDFSWDSEEIQSGLEQIRKDFEQFKPNLCVLLGNTALYAATFDRSKTVSSWRGSLFQCTVVNSPFYNLKCMATYHPAAILRTYEWAPLLHFDLRRARSEGSSPVLTLPDRKIEIQLSLDEILSRLGSIKEQHQKIALDIEGYVNNMTCLSIATCSTHGFSIPFTNGNGTSYWTESEELRLWPALASVLCNPDIPKILQNYMYDAFVLAYTYRCPIRGLVDDTMLKSWELFCELDKDLGTLCSIYTREPFYKNERKSQDMQTFWRYNVKDSCCTYEIAEEQDRQMQLPGARYHYKFNVALLAPLLYMELRGLAYNSLEAKILAAQLRKKIYALNWKLQQIAQTPELKIDISTISSLCCKKRGSYTIWSDLCGQQLKGFTPFILRIVQLCSRSTNSKLTPCELGELYFLLGYGLNQASPKQLCELLYDKLKLPVQYKKEHGRLTTSRTTDILALLNIMKDHNHPIIKILLLLSNYQTQLENLEKKVDVDGRMRCGYNVVGSETGRLSCSESPTRTGYNLQTVTRSHRHLFYPDRGMDFSGCDLSGADGWTVAAWCARLGDTTMLDDYKFGLKPAKILALMYTHGATINKLTREELKKLSKSVSGDGWLYFACKCVQHGTNYGMKERTVADTILKQSYKKGGSPIWIPLHIAKQLQTLYLVRYGAILRWHQHITNQINTYGYLESATGHRRIIFGRRTDHSTIQSGLSNEPQENTTYATNLALLKLWTDPDNRTSDNGLKIEPVHQVHDALYTQYKSFMRDWAKSKIHAYFNSALRIAGQQIVIPFEGHWSTKGWEMWEGDI